jgi:hypothetical protein
MTIGFRSALIVFRQPPPADADERIVSTQNLEGRLEALKYWSYVS